MVSKFSCFLLIFFSIVSCNNNSDTTKVKKETAEAKPQSVLNCYQYANTKDTITLKLVHIGEAITGTLVYNIYEKDKNKGTIQGKMEGDVLVANYTFMSEGITSVRQVAFKMNGNDFIEGYGETETTGDKVTFRNISSLKFNDTMKLSKTACQ
ncbi:MAG: hypothetical protein JWR18_3589 [Segetibacter sp.]|jgi:hypothetical protein|nr:hypothetical protein [Segetibacter sp.]